MVIESNKRRIENENLSIEIYLVKPLSEKITILVL